MKSKKALVSEIVSWAIAVVILTLSFIILTLINSNTAVGPTIKIEGMRASSVCNHDLLNYLRANPPEDTSITFAELAGLSQTDSAIQKKFEDYTKIYFTHFRRSISSEQNWKLELLDENLAPLANLGTLQDATVQNKCSQTIPNYDGGVFTVRLGLEY